MSLMHVTKNNECSFCGAKLKKCAEPTCQKFFHPDSERHKFHLPKCKAKNYRRNRFMRLKNKLLIT